MYIVKLNILLIILVNLNVVIMDIKVGLGEI